MRFALEIQACLYLKAHFCCNLSQSTEEDGCRHPGFLSVSAWVLPGSVGWVRVFTAAVRSPVAPLSFSKPNALARSEKSRFSSE